MMSHGAMLWGAALYNNGAFPLKNPHFGESYSENGEPQRLVSIPASNSGRDRAAKGCFPTYSPCSVGRSLNQAMCYASLSAVGPKRPK